MSKTPESQQSNESPENVIGGQHMVLFADGTLKTASAENAEELREAAAKAELEALKARVEAQELQSLHPETSKAQSFFEIIIDLVHAQILFTEEQMVNACRVLIENFPEMEPETLRQLRNFLRTIDNRTDGHGALLERVNRMISMNRVNATDD